MAANHDHQNQHFLLVTFPAQGHINPSLQFAKRLIRATTNTHITFSTATSAHHRISNNQSKLTSTSSTSTNRLAFSPFFDGHEHGFNPSLDVEDYEADLRRHGSETLRELIIALAEEGRPVTCVIYAVLIPWVAEVARDLNVPSVLLWNQAAALFDIFYYCFNGAYGEILLKNNFDDPLFSIELPGLPSLTTRDLPSFFLSSNNYKFALPSFEEHIQILKRETNPRVLVNTFDDLEPEALKSVGDGKLNLIAIGPLVPSAFLDGEDPLDTSFGGDLLEGSKVCYLEWLNSKEEASVVYVSFGSIAVLAKRQVDEIARGLFQSGRPFLWVVRGLDNGDQVMECLEDSIREGRGLIVPWCSQVEVLSHASIGCFVTHCGWNSTLESLSVGVPVVAFPQWADQTTNAKLIEDVWKTGVRVREIKNSELGGGLVESDELKRCLEMVMEGESSEEIRRNARKWRDLARKAAAQGGSSERNLGAVLEVIGKVI